MTPDEVSARMQRMIQQRALVFALDNLTSPDERDILMINTAMQIGASIALELNLEVEKDLTKQFESL